MLLFNVEAILVLVYELQKFKIFKQRQINLQLSVTAANIISWENEYSTNITELL